MNDGLYENDINIVKKKHSKHKSKIILLLSILAVVCGCIAFFAIRKYYKSTKTISFYNQGVYQFFSGIKYNYVGNATMEDDVLVGFSDAGDTISIGDFPIYYQTIDNECIIPINMGLFLMNEKGKNYRVNYFSKLQIEKVGNDEMAFIDYKNKKSYISDAFLYDGRDMYVFPYSVIITIEGKDYELSPLSYVIINYKDSVEMYNRATDEYYFIDEITEDVIASYFNNKINLSTDMIIYDDDVRLLIKNINKLNQFS